MANKLIAQGMKKKGYNEETLAKKVGVKKNIIIDWVNDYKTPSPNEQARLCKVLDIPICKLTEYYANTYGYTLN